MDAAYDDQVYVDDRTIDSHIKRLCKKLKLVDEAFDMIETLLWCRLPLQGSPSSLIRSSVSRYSTSTHIIVVTKRWS